MKIIIVDFLEKLFKTKSSGTASSTVIDIPAQVYYKHMALYTAVSLIANAIGKCEIETYANNEPVKDKDYYLLNISPNINQTSSQFWHKVIEKMIMEKEPPLVVEAGGQLFCADSYGISQEKAITGNIYENVTIGDFTFNKKFSAKDVYLFYLDNEKIASIVTGLWDDYGKVLSSAADALKRSNGRKYKLKVDGLKVGDEQFNKDYNEFIKKQLETYMKSDNAVYVEFDGYDLKAEDNQANKSATDFISLRKDMFDMIASALNIPQSLMLGEAKDMDGVTDLFLTFCVDPIADMITEGLTKVGGYDNWIKGNYYKVKTSNIFHRDIFKLADKVDKLIGSGFASVDEVRKEAGWNELNQPWSKKHWMTKNYAVADTMLDSLEGGDNNEE